MSLCILPPETFTYDAAGNRTGSATDPGYKYDAAGRLIAAEGARFAYDRNGNLVEKTTTSGRTTYSWDLENRLIGVEMPDGGRVSYAYDPFGRRIAKNVSGSVTTYLYDGNYILLEMDGEGATTAHYTHGPGVDWPLMLDSKGQTWFYHTDSLGSVVALLLTSA